ncbi:G/T mismatch-specific thymine DNA glycosylase isoform X2 [Clupea harengus]|uniref:G/T mismatch-specific thymine DNA glycosylase n=1 Tax=Clupea harengus TaxID=7950 RepID=A0A8M1KHD9_CLUHA|nr:G/T mismatch-specific thymine DNA glycosylase isoform X2 [Clupea harengus]
MTHITKTTIKMEEKNASMTLPTDYLQYWYQTSQPYFHAPEATEYHHTNNVYYNMDNGREERDMTELTVHREPAEHHVFPAQRPVSPPQNNAIVPPAKKRGRPPKLRTEDGKPVAENDNTAKKAKRTLDRFNGMSVEEVMTKTLPDIIAHNLDILIVGINPGLLSAYKGHHYPNPGNHFWKCLFLAGLSDEQLNYMHDHTLPEKYGIGFTNMVERTTPGSKDLSSKEIREGSRQLVEKLKTYKPSIAAFNGKGIYEIFCKEIFGITPKNLEFGLQPYKVPDTDTVCYLMPSSSPRCAQFPRAQDKVHFYIKLKELRDEIKGVVPNKEIEETEYSFDLSLAKEDAKRIAIKEETPDPGYEAACGPWPGTDQGTSNYSSQGMGALYHGNQDGDPLQFGTSTAYTAFNGAHTSQ